MSSNYSLSYLADYLGGKLVHETAGEVEISSVAYNSKDVSNESLFTALPGNTVDGHDFIEQAFAGGAAAALVSLEGKLKDHPGIIVADPRASLSKLAALFAGNPSKELKVVGVTGTNGKTTIVWYLYHILGRLSGGCLGMGTLGIKAEGVLDEPSLTTPDPILLHQYLSKAKVAGISTAAMEVSSHGLTQSRVSDIAFDVAVFTNLTRDHLDYHGDMESYFEAKLTLFDLLRDSPKSKKAAVVNVDSDYGKRIVDNLSGGGLLNLSYGEDPSACIRIKDFQQSFSGSKTTISYEGKDRLLDAPIIGMHNAQNLAAVFGASLAMGIETEDFLKELKAVPPVPGRLEPVGNDDFGVYVDYAHTPDALDNALATLKPLAQNRLWVVFGCGGDRDRGKRPEMADAATRYADKVVVTSDNPRTEDPGQILDDILSSGCEAYLVEADRRSAIEKTLVEVEAGDVVLIAGKGHEDYQILGTEKIHFSDQEEVRRILGNSG